MDDVTEGRRGNKSAWSQGGTVNKDRNFVISTIYEEGLGNSIYWAYLTRKEALRETIEPRLEGATFHGCDNNCQHRVIRL